MRNSVTLFSAIVCLAGCGASVRTMDVSHVPSFTVDTINAAPKETLGKVMTAEPKAFVLLLRKGEKVPVHLQASLGPIALEPGQDYLVFSQDTYMYVGPAGMLLSPDGKQWAAVQDGAALGHPADVVADLLGVECTEHAASLEAMKQRFSAHGFALTPNNMRQVRIPSGATAFSNAAGIAPGFCVRIGEAEAYFMPGIPREMESIFLSQCMPKLAQRMVQQGVPQAAVRTFHIYGMGESHIDHRLVGLVSNVPDVTVHFRTASPENHVKIVVRTGDYSKSQSVLEQVDHELRKRIGQGIYGTDGETFPMVVGKTLREAGATLALAESCTAGYAGELLTSEPGASDFFVGGVMAYANEVKTKVLGVPAELLTEHGAVSEPCARAMAEGARNLTGATIAVSITGIAGTKMDGRPGAQSVGTPGEKPVGSVCFAVAGPRPTKSVSKLFSGDRERIRRAAAFHALDMARRYFM